MPQDYAEAAKWYRKAADQGDAHAQFNLGVMYAQRSGRAAGLRRGGEVVSQGCRPRFAAAQFNLGVMYAEGQGVPQNYAEAVKWYRKAADQGHRPRPVQSRAFMYDEGQGVPQDYAEAVKWYREAADQGNARAQFNLGIMYAEGQGVPQDYVRAHMWFNLSAAQGDQNAAKNRDIAARRMTPAQIAEAQRLAREWKPTTQPTR